MMGQWRIIKFINMGMLRRSYRILPNILSVTASTVAGSSSVTPLPLPSFDIPGSASC